MILVGVGLYMLVMLGIGFYASRGTHSVTEFIVAGRSLPLWLCSVSIFATWFGSGIMMGAATSGYDRDFLLMIGEPFRFRPGAVAVGTVLCTHHAPRASADLD